MALFGGNRKVEIDIVANDQTSTVFDKVAHGVSTMADKVNNGVNSMNSGLQRYNNAMNTLYRSTQVAVAGSGYLLYKFTKDSVQQFADFERQHAKTMGAIASNYDKTADAQRRFLDDQKKLKEESLKLGTVGPTQNGSLYSPTQVSYSQTALSKAGVKPEEISQVLPQIIKFAGGNDLGLDTAADYAVNIGTMFDVPKKDWGKMMDQITRAADISTVDVPDIFESLKYAGGIAGATKRPLEEVLSMVAIMGNSGIKGSMAGTGIQAFMTRLLAPTKPMKNTLEAAPSDKVIELLGAFTKETTDDKGKFKDAATVTGMLDKVMEQLDDREQAWFSKQLFGMFQMKAGFTLAKNGGDTFQNVQDDIVANAPGTNDRKWDVMLNSSYGKQVALSNAIQGIKTDVGYRLSPITNAVADELFKVLTDKGNYKIDFSKINSALEEASKMMGDQYGTQIGDFVHGTGKILISGSRVAVANEPLVEGAGVALTKLLQGDVAGAFSALKDSVGKTDDKIKELPPELQSMAKEVRNAVLALGTLAAVDFAARLLENVSTLWKYTVGQLIKTPTMTVTATTVILRDTGVLDKNGKPIYKQEEVTTKEPTDKGGKGGGGGTGGIGGGTLIFDKDGKPVKPKDAPTQSTSTILDKNGNPMSSTPKTEVPSSVPATGAGRFGKLMSNTGKIVNGVSWAYALGEMFGLNDKLLDKAGATEGTKSREVIDKGRTGLNYGLMASFADDMVLRGYGKQLLGKGIKAFGNGMVDAVKATPSVVKGIPGIVRGIPSALARPIAGMAETSMPLNGVAQAGTLIESGPFAGLTSGGVAAGALPFAAIAGGLLVLADAYKQNKKGEENRQMIQDASKTNTPVYWTKDGQPFLGFSPQEQQKRIDESQYNFRGTIGGDGVAFRQAAPNKWLHPFKYNAWKKQQEELDAKDAQDKKVWEFAKSKYQETTGQKLTWDNYAKNQDQWTQAFTSGITTMTSSMAGLSTALGTNGNTVTTANNNTVSTITGKVNEVGAKVDMVQENTSNVKSILFTGKDTDNKPAMPGMFSILPKGANGGLPTLQEYLASFSGKNGAMSGDADSNTRLDALNQSMLGVKEGQVPISTTLQQLYGITPTNTDVNSRLDSVNSNLQALQNQKPPVVNVQPPTVNVDVKVDKDGNVQKNQYIIDTNPLDNVFKQYDRRFGK